jgi:hypothetical protein
MPQPSEDKRDIENVEAWAEIFRNILHLTPIERRAEVLALVSKNNEAERAAGVRILSAAEFCDPNTPGLRNWHIIMRLASLVIQVFTRRIVNNHSAKEATAILFAPHPYGRGSRLLRDYLRRLA